MKVEVSQGWFSANKSLRDALGKPGVSAINVAPATYVEDVTIRKSVAIAGKPGATVFGNLMIGDGAKVLLKDLTVRGQIQIFDGAEVTLDGVTAETTGIPALRASGQSKVTARRFAARGDSNAAYLTEKAQGSFEDCSFHCDGEYPAFALDQQARATLARSTVDATKSTAIAIEDNAVVTLDGITAASADLPALRADGHSKVTAKRLSGRSNGNAVFLTDRAKGSFEDCSFESGGNYPAFAVGQQASATLSGSTVASSAPASTAIQISDDAALTATGVKAKSRANVLSLYGQSKSEFRDCSVEGAANNEAYSAVFACEKAISTIVDTKIASAAGNALLVRGDAAIKCVTTTLDTEAHAACATYDASRVDVTDCVLTSTTHAAVLMEGTSRIGAQGGAIRTRSAERYALCALNQSVAEVTRTEISNEKGLSLKFAMQSSGSLVGARIKGGFFVEGEATLRLNGGEIIADGSAIRLVGNAKATVHEIKTSATAEDDVSLFSFRDEAEIRLTGIVAETDCDSFLFATGRVTGVVEDCRFVGAKSFGVALVEDCALQFRQCRIEKSGQANLTAAGGTSQFDKCVFADSGDDGVVLSNGSSVVLRGCTISGSSDLGLLIGDRTFGRIERCSIVGNARGVFVSGTADPAIVECTVEDNAESGMTFCDSALGTIERNIVRHNGGEQQIVVLDDARPRLTDNATTAKRRAESGPAQEARPATTAPAGSGALVDARRAIESMIGLAKVKTAIAELADFVEVSAQRRRLGLGGSGVITLHSLFLGKPGTGKTTVARHFGAVLHALDVLPSARVVTVERKDLVGEHIGETAQKTRRKIEEALGGVLFVDEAYALARDPSDGRDFGVEAIDTLITQMEDRRGEFVVIAAGYPTKMLDFIKSNPGLKDRFAYTFDFEDYRPEELLEIFRRRIESEGFTVARETEALVAEEFRGLYANRTETFSNGRLVRNLVERITVSHAQRIARTPYEERSKEMLSEITAADVGPLLKHASGFRPAESIEAVLSDLDGLVGLGAVKAQVRRIADIVAVAQERRRLGMPGMATPVLHSVYLGNPGTGKTTVARLMGRAFKALGVLERSDVVEAKRADLVAGYIGQTATKTRKVIESAMGGVLFIDEAYALTSSSQNDFGQEAIDTLLVEMDNRRHSLVVIVAGYPEPMQAFLNANPGLRSRFTQNLVFEDYRSEDMAEIFYDFAEAEGLSASDAARGRLGETLTGLHDRRDASFGNGRAVRNLFDAVKENLAARVMKAPAATRTVAMLSTIEAEDFPAG